MTKTLNKKHHMKLEKVIAISGKPGLYEIISQSKSGVIVESLSEKKRFPVNSLHNISTLLKSWAIPPASCPTACIF